VRSISLTLIGITILMLGVIGPVRGNVTVLESGYRLQGCGIFGCSDSTACGTEATITPSYSQINNPQDSVAYFTSIDYVDSSNNHYWAQAGYVIGYAPPTGLHYSQPEIYFETNGLYYSFTAIESASWNYPITFQVWIKSFIANGNQNDPIFTLSINGANLPGYDAEFPSGFAKGGTVNDFVEVHQSSGQIDLATASWSNLMAQDIDPGSQPPWDGFCHPLAGWASWSHSYVLHQDTP